MLVLLSIVLPLVVIFVGFITFVILWGEDSALEKYYKKSLNTAKVEKEYLSKLGRTVPEEIIVDSKQKFSPFRKFIKRLIARILRKEVPPTILVFGKNEEADQKAFIIQSAFKSILSINILEIDFLESLICYYAYRYAENEKTIEDAVKIILRRQFEKSDYRWQLVSLDDLGLKQNIVLNPPLEPGTLLEILILPMIYQIEKHVTKEPTNIVINEKFKLLLMNLIEMLCGQKCAVLFVGCHYASTYFTGLRNKFANFDGVIIAARGENILEANVVIHIFFNYCRQKKIEISSTVLTSRWDAGAIQKDCVWHIVARTKTLPGLESFIKKEQEESI